MELIKKYLPYILPLLFGFFLGAFVGVRYFAPALTQHHYTTTENQPIIVNGETKTETKTQIAYVPKETVIVKYIDVTTGKEVIKTKTEDTDLQADVGKQTFHIVLNGKPIEFTKNDDEKYIFDKNKVTLTQDNTITFKAEIEPIKIDNTRKYSLGVGYGTNGTAVKVDFPIGNNNYFGGWAYGDKDTKTVGANIRF